jgi:hypothetical protein
MPTTAPRPDARRRAEADAWRAYQQELHELRGRDYEDSEGLAWARLQLRLDEIARTHADHGPRILPEGEPGR